MRHSIHRHESGFTLVEAMIALLIMAFGMLAIAGFQITLTRSADVAKQRSEAVRLAQQTIEQLRSYVRLDSDGVGNQVDYTSDLQSGQDTIVGGAAYNANVYSSNTTFLRTWTVTRDGTAAIAADGSDPQKWIAVTVQWADRSAASPTAYNQSVTLTSVISSSDPGAIRFIQNNAGSTTNRKPKNRSINIPYPAQDLGHGRSAFRPGGAANVYFVFDNVTGLVTYRCTGTTLLDPEFGGTCTAFATANVLLSGYIYWYTPTPQPNANDLTLSLTGKNNNLQEPPPLDYSTAVTATGETNAVGIQFYSPTASTTKECFVAQQMVVSSTHTIVAYDAAQNRDYAFATYLCVVQPVVVAATGPVPRWFGQFTVKLSGTLALGTDHKLCRFSGDFDGDNVLSNNEHPLFYRGVVDTLDNQNAVLVQAGHTCPTDTEMAPLASPAKFTNNNTIVHQSVAAGDPLLRPYGGDFSTGPQWTSVESATDTVELPMD